MDIFSRADVHRQNRADSDLIYAYFFGHRDMSPVMQRILSELDSYDLSDHMMSIMRRAATHDTRTPMLFLLIMGMWCGVKVEGCPLRSEKFAAVLDNECVKMVTGKYVNINEFINNVLTEYII